ncbi:MAG: BREX system P-loop protein BrxC, partial [Deltaproteobacteria bacterium]
LKLQSFVSELGQRLKGRVWLLATGQQRLDEAPEAKNLGKLKDRFPPALRVHLASTNIRDVVHKRLLKKARDKESILRDLFTQHRSDLKLNGYRCEEITEEDFVEVYPLLPGHVDLLMQITSNLRVRSSRAQGDDHAIRGLLQLLGELFREQKLGERPVGDLIAIDAIFDVQQTALDPDVQNTLLRIFNDPSVRDDALAIRVAKAVALLELVQEQQATTVQLIAQCLYDRIGSGGNVAAIPKTLESLRAANLIGYSEKLGFKIQSSTGQEWQREREDFSVSADQVSALVRDVLRELMGDPERPKFKGLPFAWNALYSDTRGLKDERITDSRNDASFTVDLRFLAARDDRSPATWAARSDDGVLRDRLVWLSGDPGAIDGTAHDLGKSKAMVNRYDSRRESLAREKQSLLIEERTRSEELARKLEAQVADAFLNGTMFFRARPMTPREFASGFSPALIAVATRLLPDLYPHFTEITVSDKEVAQLLDATLSGPSAKFLDGALGILSLDAGKYVPTCAGAVPTAILSYLETHGASGTMLVARFGQPPYGYSIEVIRACLIGLLRANRLRVQPAEGHEITSFRDPNVKDLFRLQQELRRAEFFPARAGGLQPRDRVAICNFFKKAIDLELERENEAIADAAYSSFPHARDRLRGIETQLQRLPGTVAAPRVLTAFGRALEDCMRSRQIEPTVLSVKKNLDALREGFEQLGIFQTELSDDAVQAVRDAARVRDQELEQLRSAEALAGIEDDAREIAAHLGSDRPWKDVVALTPHVKKIRDAYADVRRRLLNAQLTEIDSYKAAVKSREGFGRLSAVQAHDVLRPFTEAVFDTTPEAVAPTLVELRDRFRLRLAHAQTAAPARLDELLRGIDGKEVAALDVRIHGREIATREQLDAVLGEIRERVVAQLDLG